MIKIGHPQIETKEGKTYLKAFINNDAENVKEWLWFATDEAYGRYFCQETSDAFVLPMILRAVKTHQDVYVESAMSERLFHNLNESVFYAMCKTNEKKTGEKYKNIVKIHCDNLISKRYENNNSVGTGCSLGVDSFAVIKRYFFNNESLPSYKITHLTLFNAGAFGSKEKEGARKSFFNEIERSKKFADKLGLPFVWVDSNIRSFFPEFSFDWSHTYLNMSVVLSMQKLWRKYLYASGYSVDHLEFDIDDSAKYEPYLIPMLSTENTELISANMNMRRSDKVDFISDDKMVQENLYVCLKEQIRNNPNSKYVYKGNYLNCGQCKKCHRTMLQLDILGKEDLYRNIFDYVKWPKEKEEYIAEVVVGKDKDLMYHDLYESMLEHGYPLPLFKLKLLYYKIHISWKIRSVWRRMKKALHF